MEKPRYWIGVASKEHVLKGVAESFCQLCHGKSNPLTRLNSGDWIIYYSPHTTMAAGEVVQAFTAIGQVLDREPYRVEMDNGFVPYRRDVRFLEAQDAPIRPLVEELSFIKNKKNWGYVFRFGLIEIPAVDFERIAAAMKAEQHQV
jgi:predicted RNA-binding protein